MATEDINYENNVSLGGCQIKDVVVEVVTNLPTAYTQGRIVSKSGDLYICKGTTWVKLGDASAVDSLTTRVTSVEGRVTTAEGDIDALETRMTTAEGGIRDNASAIQSLDGRLDTAEDDIDALETTVGNASSGLVKKVNDNANAITAIQNAGYITKDVDNLTNYYKKTDTYTKGEVNTAISTAVTGAYKVKGSKTVAQINALSGMVQGDVYNVTDGGQITDGPLVNAGDNIVWDGSAWDKLAGTIDLTDYYTRNEVDGLLDDKVDANSAITGATKCKITYDAKGLVTAGSNLAEADIPTLSISKISGLQSALDGKVDENTAISPVTTATLLKIKYDAKGLITGSASVAGSDIPNIAESQVTNLTTDLAGKVNTLQSPPTADSTFYKVTVDGQGLVKSGQTEKLTVSDISDIADNYLGLHATADKATQLANTRTFSITGKATASAQNFNGTQNVALNVTSLDASGLTGTVPDACIAIKVGEKSFTTVAGTNYTFAHGLGKIPKTVSVWDSATGEIVMCYVKVDATNITVNTNSARTLRVGYMA